MGAKGGANRLFFCDKETGAARFRAEESGNQGVLVERIASQLAVHCLARGHEPEDFLILAPAEKSLVEKLVSRANELLEEGRAASTPVSLTARQKEILHSVVRNQANKEIAAKMNITVRTVKFHISSLLEKFGAENRMELAMRASGVLQPKPHECERPGIAQLQMGAGEPLELGPIPVQTIDRARAKARNLGFPGRILTA